MKFLSVKLLFILITITAPIWLTGQSTFSLISKSGAEVGGTKLTEGPEYEKAKAIYDKLVEARGDKRFEPPVFTMSTDEENVAFFMGKAHRIGLEKKAYNICMSLGEKEGENAIAALLGHELIHFYEKHHWRSGFAETYSNLSIGTELKRLAGVNKITQETQADYLGGFLAFSAGFDVYKGLPEFFDKIYAEYPLKDEDMKGNYPIKEDRKAMAVNARKKLERLVEVFDMANLLTAINRYEEARAFYKYILIDYQGREIYNNLGVLTVLEAMTYLTEKERLYRLPVELDLNFGSSSRSGAADARKAKRVALLREAIVYFNNAISLDPDYAPAYLNLACAYFLLEDNELSRAQFYAEVEAKQKAAANNRFEKTGWGADVLLALVAIKQGKDGDAKALLEPLKDKLSVAEYNYNILTGAPTGDGKTSNGPEYEAIDDIEIDGIRTATRNMSRSNPDEIREEILFDELTFRVFENMGSLKNSKIYHCNPSDDDNPQVYIHLTDPGYSGEIYNGIKVGTPLSEVKKQYPNPKYSVETTNGLIIGYDQMLFILGKDLKVKRWAHYFKRGS